MTFAHGMARLTLAGCCLAAVDVAAQPRTGRPPTPGLEVRGSLYGGYDSPLFDNNALAVFQPTSQAFGGMDAILNYSRPGRRVTMAANATVATRYYPDFTPSTTPSYGASLLLNSVSGGRWRWGLGQHAYYSPLSAATLFAGTNAGNITAVNSLGATALAWAPNLQISPIRQVDVNTSALLSYSVSRRTHVSVEATAGSQIQIDSTLPRAVRYDARLRVGRDVLRRLRVYGGYSATGVRVPAQGATPGFTSQIGGFDFGFDFSYSRPFQLTRDTTFGFQTGIASVPNAGRSELQLVGSATLDHRVSRTWAAQLVATRDARYVQAYRDPVVLSGVSASVGGQLAFRIGAAATANYSSGRVNSAPAPLAFDTASTSVQMRYDIMRRVGVFVEYSLFRSSFDAGSTLSGYPTGSFGRHGVRAGLSLGVAPFTRRP